MSWKTHIQSIPIRRTRLQIPARLAQALTPQQLCMLDLHRVVAPRIRIVRPPQPRIFGQRIWFERRVDLRLRIQFRYLRCRRQGDGRFRFGIDDGKVELGQFDVEV